MRFDVINSRGGNLRELHGIRDKTPSESRETQNRGDQPHVGLVALHDLQVTSTPIGLSGTVPTTLVMRAGPG